MINIKYFKNAAIYVFTPLACILFFGIQAALAQTSPSDYTVGTRYNLNGQVVGVINSDPDGNGIRLFSAVRNTYNVRGLLESIESGVLHSWQSESIEPKNWTSFDVSTIQRFTYDGWGRKLTEATQDNTSTTLSFKQYSYDNLGRLECEAVRMNLTPAVLNSLPGSACTLTAVSINGNDRVTKYTYDTSDRVQIIEKAYGTSLRQNYASYTYNVFWEKETIVDANNNLSRMEYDGFGRLKNWYFPSKTTGAGISSSTDYEHYEYDENGNRTKFKKRDGQTITFEYDDLNRVFIKHLPNAAEDVYYGYDNRNLQKYAHFGSATGKGNDSVYDGFGRLTSEISTMASTSRALSYEYDNNGNRTKVTHPDGNYFVYGYDGINQIETIRENASSTNAVKFNYDDLVRRTSVAFESTASTNYGYDTISRLQVLGHDLSGSANDIAYGFDYNPASQMTSRTISNGSYAYKGNQNITGSYSVNGLNEYTSVAGKTFTHDDNGNLTSDGSTTFGYDTENRLTSTAGATNAVLSYDPAGRLFQVVSGGNTTQFLYSGDALVGEYNASGTLLRRYVHSSRVDEPYLWYEGNTVNSANRRYLQADYQGSIVAVSGNTASLVGAVNSYDAYGIPAATNIGRFSYTGQIYLPEIGLHYYKARIYSSKLGRFLQTDPIGYKDDLDLYSYVGNDPVNHTDPTGLSCDRNPSNPSVVSNCQIDKVPEKMSKKEQDAVNAYNKQYTAKVQGLFKNPTKSTTVTLADGSKVKTTNGALGRALEGRNVVYDPKKAGDGASTRGDTTTLSTAAVTGYRADGSALTAPGISVTGPALTGIILEHEGLHGTIDRNTPDSNNPSHQEEYNRAAKEIDDSIR